jgi:7-carboxy-7-deazaguanine synthase
VELTGGEPLLQAGCLTLMTRLCDAGFKVLLETNGALDIGRVDRRVHRIVDLKCPSSGETEENRWENLEHLHAEDEIKFVIATEEDYGWAKRIIQQHGLANRCALLVSWASPLTKEQQSPVLKACPPEQHPLTRQQLAEAIIRDALPVRFQVQLHKVIWTPDARGV